LTANNVVALGARRPSTLDKDEEERLEAVVDEIMSNILESAMYYNFEIKNSHDLGLICETIRSGMHRQLGKKHALQDLADNIIQVVD
jgi:hypothetical protein